MGRSQYLTRLALGRSAFQVEEPAEQLQVNGNGGQNGEEEPSGQSLSPADYAQLYDSKGRPYNPNTQRLNSELRAAQNDILSLVGVVEKKDTSDLREEMRRMYMRQSRRAMLAEENDRGELLEYAIVPIKFFARLWTDAFVQRVQVGLYDPGSSMAEILSQEWRSLHTGNARHTLASLFPGLGDTIAHILIRLPLILGVEQFTGQLQKLTGTRRFSRKTTQKAYWAISFLYEALLLAIDVGMLPMEYYASAQRSRLAPAMPLFPPPRSFLPWDQTSFHQFGWKHLVGVALFRSFTSPAALLLIQRIVCFDTDEEAVPVLSLLTDFRYPSINDSPSTVKRPECSHDPVGWIAYHTWRVRAYILKTCNWNLVKRSTRPGEDDHENNTLAFHPDRSSYPTWRSTDLAQLVPRAFNDLLRNFFHRIWTLPFDSLLYRSIATTYVASPLTLKTPGALAAAPHLYATFGGGPVSQLLRSPASSATWSAAGTYLNRLGLALALHTSVDTILLFGIYSFTRYLGRTQFAWQEPVRSITQEESSR